MTPNNAAFARRGSSSRLRLLCAKTRMPRPSRFARDSAVTCAVAAPTPACCWQSLTRRKRRKEPRNMANAKWPTADKRTLIGKRIDRIDGPLKSTGTAKYSYDINRQGMLWAKLITSPHAKAEIVSVNLDAAAKMPGVKATWKDDSIKDIQYVGQIIGAVAAETEEIATEAAQRVKVEYKVLEHQVIDTNPELSKDKPSQREVGKVDEGFGQSDTVVTGQYGIPVIAHCCLESHGQVTDYKDGELLIWTSMEKGCK